VQQRDKVGCSRSLDSPLPLKERRANQDPGCDGHYLGDNLSSYSDRSPHASQFP
jgi:hypothetical protein